MKNVSIVGFAIRNISIYVLLQICRSFRSAHSAQFRRISEDKILGPVFDTFKHHFLLPNNQIEVSCSSVKCPVFLRVTAIEKAFVKDNTNVI